MIPSSKWKAELREAIADLLAARLRARDIAAAIGARASLPPVAGGARLVGDMRRELAANLNAAAASWERIDSLLADVPPEPPSPAVCLCDVGIVGRSEGCPLHDRRPDGAWRSHPETGELVRVLEDAVEDERARRGECLCVEGLPAMAGCPVHDREPESHGERRGR